MTPIFNRNELNIKPLSKRISKSDKSIIMELDAEVPAISSRLSTQIDTLVAKVLAAKQKNAPVVLIYGAHMFRNGLSPYIIKLMELGYINHLVTNGAGVIHDWELSYQGETTEDVKKYLKSGQFGIWEETGFYQNLAIILGAANSLGYGESIGKMMDEDSLIVPSWNVLQDEISTLLKDDPTCKEIPAKLTLLQTIELYLNQTECYSVKHPFKEFSLVYQAYQLGIPFSVCPGIGYDIIYTHPINNGASIGQCALQDFLYFTNTLSKIKGGVIISIGSAIMGPQITEKALSMAKNIALQNKKNIDDFHINVIDIQPGDWDWSQGEPPKEHPAYFLRFCKSFSRLGGEFSYLEVDNRAFVQHLYQKLIKK